MNLIYDSIITSRADAEGISFAIPINDALSIIKHLKDGKNIIRPVIGAKMVSLNNSNRSILSKSYMLHQDQKGVLITSVAKGSPADVAGILKGDIISQIDGDAVNSVHHVLKKIGLRINDDIKIIIHRHIPFEQDWSGRTFTFLTEIKEFTLSNLGVDHNLGVRDK